MGNNNCKQCTSSVFQDEEDEENWFEWMESTEDKGGRNMSISPKTELLAVQPELFRVDVTGDKRRSAKGKFTGSKKTINGLNVSSFGDDGAFRSEMEESIFKDNNNSTKRTRDQHGFDEGTIVADGPQDYPTGELNVSLCYDAGSRRFKVHVVKARNLCCKAAEGKKHDRCGVSCSDLYVKISLLSGGKILQSHRTSTKKGSTEVLIYENCAFDLSTLDYRELTLQLAAMHCCKNFINLDHVIGYVDTDCDSSERSLAAHWFEVITCPGKTVNRWHTLWI